MSTWRRKAIERFPDLRAEIQRGDTSLHGVFSTLLARLERACDEGDRAAIAPIFAYAAWCLSQPGDEVWNAAGVSFYEDLFDGSLWGHRQWTLPHVTSAVASEVWSLWEWHLPAEKLEVLRGRFPDAPPPAPPRAPTAARKRAGRQAGRKETRRDRRRRDRL